MFLQIHCEYRQHHDVILPTFIVLHDIRSFNLCLDHDLQLYVRPCVLFNLFYL